MIKKPQTDRRVQKTITALREAFFELVLTYSYDEIKVSDIIEQANVGRATFYQHYKNKDELLAVSLHGPLSTLAASIEDGAMDDDLVWLVEHFWENRKFAPRIFSGTARRIVILALTTKIEDHLKQLSKGGNTKNKIPINLLAHQLAEAQMTVIIDWLLGYGNCSATDMANHVKNTSVALCKAL